MTTNDPARTTAPPTGRLLTFRSGGWVILLSVLISGALIGWAIAPVLLGTATPPPGNGRTIESFAFDLDNLQVPRALLAPAMHHRDLIVPMHDPTVLDGRMVARLNRERGKYIVPTERVAGVVVNGEARAYPISVLNVHEVVHDTLGETPIAVTWHWPSGALVVFDRRVDGRTVEFGVSGLVYNSNLLLYERSDAATPGGEPLLSQMLARRISGPGAEHAAPLTILPGALVSWSRWLELHPDTTVIDRDPRVLRRRYNKSSPDQYLIRGRPIFPAEPAVPDWGPGPLTEIVTVRVADEARVYPLPLIAERAGADGRWRDTLAGVPIAFQYDPASSTVAVEAAGARTARALWFAWHAMFPEDELRE
jgi:hypothetical protein